MEKLRNSTDFDRDSKGDVRSDKDGRWRSRIAKEKKRRVIEDACESIPISYRTCGATGALKYLLELPESNIPALEKHVYLFQKAPPHLYKGLYLNQEGSNFLQTLRSSFSAVSKPSFASKYSFESS